MGGRERKKEKTYQVKHKAVDGSEMLLSVDACFVFRTVFMGANS